MQVLRVLLALALAGAPLSASLASVEGFSGRVVGVSDGDTISVMRDGRAVKVRLEGIDCPEGGQDFGQRAKQKTSALVFGKDVLVEVRDHDRYGRTVGRVYVGGNDVSLTLVQAGMAWHYKAYSSEAALAVAEQEARSARRGLWSDPNAIPPWEYRATPKALAVSTPFVGNVSSHVVHSSTCRHAGCKNCKKGFNDLDVAVAAGFKPGGCCLSGYSAQSKASPQPATGTVYHGNRKSHVLHRPGCRYYTCKNCTAYFRSVDEAKGAGYRPGGCCMR